MNGICAKQEVNALIITPEGERFEGTNWCSKPQVECPRETHGYGTGEGYHLCTEICGQSSHAEVDAIKKADIDLTGATLYLKGHEYVCNNCKSEIENVGITKVVIEGVTGKRCN